MFVATYGLLTNPQYLLNGQVKYKLGTIRDYKLAAYAHLTIEKSVGETVQVCLYDESFVETFDSLEGYPDYYDRIIVPVITDNDYAVSAYVYVMNDTYKNSNDQPSLHYIDICYEGYAMRGMKLSQLDNVFIPTKGN